ncbi:hypothetical protein B0A53_04381 [Rhodotorula sp. CCFEE 5036]|nr:hypothetical protein B0A53_04381 [Rhodotorula sp. CCFEE 5036]
MFGQLGNKLFGPDPKLEFTKPGHGLDLLARSSATIPEDSPYWRQYLTLFDSPTDLVLLLPASQLAHALRSNPRNVVSLIRYCVRTLVRHASGTQRRKPGWEKEVMNAVRVLARVLPVVLAPRQSAAAAGEDEFELAVFWAQESRVRFEPDEEDQAEMQAEPSSGERPASASAEEGQFVLADEDDDEDQEEEGDGTDAPRPQDNSAPNASPPPQPPLAEQLLAALVDLLFVPGLTLPRSSVDDSRSAAVVIYTIWEYGIASPAPPQQSSASQPLSVLLARLEILRLLSLLISLPSLLTPPGLFPTIPNRWRDALVSGRVVGVGGGDKKVVLCLLCSVLNTALAEGVRIGNQHPQPQPQPHGAASGGFEGLKERAARLAAETARRTTHAATGAAASTFSGGASAGGGNGEPTDELTARLALVETCWQFLDVVLVEHAAPAVDNSPTIANQFAYYFSRLHRPGDFDLLAKGMVGFLEAGLLANPTTAGAGLAASSSSLFAPLAGMLSSASVASGPTTAATVTSRCTTETLAVLLRLIETNRKFVQHHLVSENPALLVRALVAVVASMVDCALEGEEAKLGLVRLASIVLQSLTAQVAGGGHGVGGKEGLVRALNAPLEPRVIGLALAAVVKRQVAAQGIETDVADAGYGGGGAGSDQKAEAKIVTFSEYLVISLHALVLPADPPSASYRAALSTLYPSLLLSVTNLSPLMREIENEAATRLVRVWLAFSAPSWVLMEEGNPRLVFYLLEAFNNIAQYNLDRNPYLFYALAVSLPRFDLLANFTLALGIAEARRLRAARRERLRPIREGAEDDEASSSSSAARRPSHDGPSEKALGKRRASLVSLGGLSLSDTHAADATATATAPTLTLSRSESSASLGGASLSGEAVDAMGENRPFVGRNGFTPTESWVASWREGLPLDTLLVLLSEIRHRLAELDPRFPASNPSIDVISSLRKVLASKEVQTILPPKPDSFPRTRKFLASPSSNSWLASVIYARLYLSQIDYLRDSLPVQLFAVAHAPKHAPRLGQLGAEMERVSRSAVQVGGRVGGVLSGVLGRFA